METSLPFDFHLKCLTTSVRCTSSDRIPASSKGVAENGAGRADEGLILLVLSVAGLLTDQHQGSRLRPDAKHDLCCSPV